MSSTFKSLSEVTRLFTVWCFHSARSSLTPWKLLSTPHWHARTTKFAPPQLKNCLSPVMRRNPPTHHMELTYIHFSANAHPSVQNTLLQLVTCVLHIHKHIMKQTKTILWRKHYLLGPGHVVWLCIWWTIEKVKSTQSPRLIRTVTLYSKSSTMPFLFTEKCLHQTRIWGRPASSLVPAEETIGWHKDIMRFLECYRSNPPEFFPPIVTSTYVRPLHNTGRCTYSSCVFSKVLKKLDWCSIF